MDDFKPSQVVLHKVPLVGTMGKAEIELTAAYLVRACVVLGDQWQAVTIREIVRVTREDYTAGNEPMRAWGSQPWVQPAPALLVERGFAQWAVDSTEDALLFTPQGLEAMSRYVRKEG